MAIEATTGEQLRGALVAVARNVLTNEALRRGWVYGRRAPLGYGDGYVHYAVAPWRAWAGRGRCGERRREAGLVEDFSGAGAMALTLFGRDSGQDGAAGGVGLRIWHGGGGLPLPIAHICLVRQHHPPTNGSASAATSSFSHPRRPVAAFRPAPEPSLRHSACPAAPPAQDSGFSSGPATAVRRYQSGSPPRCRRVRSARRHQPLLLPGRPRREASQEGARQCELAARIRDGSPLAGGRRPRVAGPRGRQRQPRGLPLSGAPGRRGPRAGRGARGGPKRPATAAGGHGGDRRDDARACCPGADAGAAAAAVEKGG